MALSAAAGCLTLFLLLHLWGWDRIQGLVCEFLVSGVFAELSGEQSFHGLLFSGRAVEIRGNPNVQSLAVMLVGCPTPYGRTPGSVLALSWPENGKITNRLPHGLGGPPALLHI